MDGNWPNSSDSETPSQNSRMVGMVMLGLGLLLGGWVVTIIYRLINGDDTSGIIGNLIPIESLEVMIRSSSDAILLPDSLFYVVGLLTCVLLLWICAGFAKLLISQGSKFLQPDIEEVLKRFPKDRRKH